MPAMLKQSLVLMWLVFTVSYPQILATVIGNPPWLAWVFCNSLLPYFAFVSKLFVWWVGVALTRTTLILMPSVFPSYSPLAF